MTSPLVVGRPRPRDVGLGVAVALLSLGGILTGQVDEGPRWITLPVAVVGATALAWRVAAPFAAVTAVAVAGLVQAVPGDSPGTLWALMTDLVLAYTVAVECAESLATAGLVVTVGSLWIQEWLDDGTDYPFIALVFGGAWLLGRGTRSWRDRATLAEEHQRDLARLAVAEERTRIARELHDVVAHALSVIAVQADAAEAALARDAGRAAAPLRAIRSSATDALDDMRTLLHLLRRDEADDASAADGPDDPDDPGERRPARGLADLPALVASVRQAGLPLEASIGRLPDLPAGAQLAVYRIVQECLTNVVKHAGRVPTCLTVAPEGDGVRVVVRNAAGAADARAGGPGGSGGAGHGLVGVRERVRATGGTLRAHPTPDGGFEVTATLDPAEVP